MGNDNSIPIKKVKLNCIPIVSVTAPVERIPVPSSELEKLHRSISEKCNQNANSANRAKEVYKDIIVK